MDPVHADTVRATARAAARAYLDGDVSVEYLGHGDCIAHRLRSARGEYLLRLHALSRPPADRSFEEARAIASECLWLEALGRVPGLVAPTPVPSLAGGFVTEVALPGRQGSVPCTLLTWVTGERVEGRRSADQARGLGGLLATLHEHARSWRPPADFWRPAHDRRSWGAALERTGSLVDDGLATGAQVDLLHRAFAAADAELSPLSREPGRVGLIHADLHAENYVAHGDSLRPIDFGRAGFGPWLYDVAECAGHLGPERRRDLLAAYGERFPLEDGDVRRIEGYFITSLIEVFGNHAPFVDGHDYLERALPAWSPHFERYVAGEPFLLEL